MRFLSRHSALLIPIVLGVLILAANRLPFLQAHHGHDQGGYMYMGKAIANGGVPYLDVWDHKTPGLPYIHAVVYTLGGDSIATFRFIEFLWVVLTLIVFVLVLRRIYSNSPPLVIGISIVYFALALSHIDFVTKDGGGYTESFLLLPTLLAVLAAACYEQTKRWWLPLLTGVLLFVSVMIKQSVALLALPLAGFFAAVWWTNWRAWKQLIRPIGRTWLLFAAGFFVPLGLWLGYLAAVGAWPAFIDNAFYFNSIYAGGVTLLTKFLGSIYIAHQYTLGFPITYILLIAGVVVLLAQRSRYSLLLLGWFITDMIAITSTNKFYGHYYVQLFPVLGLIATASISSLTTATKHLYTEQRNLVIFACIPLLFLLFIPYVSNPAMAYITNWSELRSRVLVENTNTVTPEIVAYVTQHTNPGDRMFIWNSSQIYLYLKTDTWSPVPYFHFIPFSDTYATNYATPERWQELQQSLKNQPPKLIVLNESGIRSMKTNKIVWDYVSAHYRLDATITDSNGATELYLINPSL